MEYNDHIIDFYTEIDVLAETISDVIINNLSYTPYGVKDTLANALRFVLYQQRDKYLKRRNSHIGSSEILHEIVSSVLGNNLLEKINSPHVDCCRCQFPHIYKSIPSYLFYCNGPRMLTAIRPFLTILASESILLWDSTKSLRQENLPSTLKVIPISQFALHPINSIIDCINRVLHYHNLFEIILDQIKPVAIVGTEGCQTHLKILAHISNQRTIKSICMQHSWPSFFHGAFRNLPYSHFITWGKKFNELWSRFSQFPRYISSGYASAIQAHGAHDSITFFLQAPLYITTPDIFSRIFLLALKCAAEYQYRKILIRPHPEYPLPDALRKAAESFKNIVIADNWPIDAVYAETFVSVSHFSSCMMEGLIHGCRPVVFDPVFNSCYYPNLENEGIGFIAKSESHFFEILNQLMLCYKSPTVNLSEWFEATGDKAIIKVTDFLRSIR